MLFFYLFSILLSLFSGDQMIDMKRLDLFLARDRVLEACRDPSADYRAFQNLLFQAPPSYRGRSFPVSGFTSRSLLQTYFQDLLSTSFFPNSLLAFFFLSCRAPTVFDAPESGRYEHEPPFRTTLGEGGPPAPPPIPFLDTVFPLLKSAQDFSASVDLDNCPAMIRLLRCCEISFSFFPFFSLFLLSLLISFLYPS